MLFNYLNIKNNIYKLIRHISDKIKYWDIRGMAAGEISLHSLLKISIWTGKIQQRIPCSTSQTSLRDWHIETTQVGKWEQRGVARRKKRLDKPETQPCSLKLTVKLSQRGGKIRLWLVLPSAGRSREI